MNGEDGAWGGEGVRGRAELGEDLAMPGRVMAAGSVAGAVRDGADAAAAAPADACRAHPPPFGAHRAGVLATRRGVLRAASVLPFAPWLHVREDGPPRSLLVLELAGGNDGLNTLVPVDDAVYARLRPRLAQVRRGSVRVFDSAYALHEALGAGRDGGLAGLMQRGVAAAVHGVGSPRPDRSHFRSRDVWHTADPDLDERRGHASGWLGRAADWLAARGSTMPGLAFGGPTLPLLLRGERVVVPVLERLEDYTLRAVAGDAAGLARLATEGGAAGDALQAHLRGVAAAAARAAAAFEGALAAYRPRAEYPEGPLGRDLQLVARAAVSGFGARLLHVTFGGFDTHAQQLPTHAALLRQLGEGLAALAADLTAHDRLAQTAVLVFSEFGRRAAENGSLGTDHGAAAPVFVVGGGVRAGLHGAPPDLGRLIDGDVPCTTDFRQVYAALLRWLGIDTEAVLGAGFEGLELFV